MRGDGQEFLWLAMFFAVLAIVLMIALAGIEVAQ